MSPMRKMRREVQDLSWRLNSGLPDFKNEAAGSVPALPLCSHVALDTLPYLSCLSFFTCKMRNNKCKELKKRHRPYRRILFMVPTVIDVALLLFTYLLFFCITNMSSSRNRANDMPQEKPGPHLPPRQDTLQPSMLLRTSHRSCRAHWTCRLSPGPMSSPSCASVI